MFTKCINCCASIIFCVIFACLLVENSVALKRTLRHYEVFHKDDIVHRIVKRGVKQSSNPYNTIKELEFKTLGKNFRVILHPHRDVLHSKFRAYAVDADGNETVVHLDHDNFYTGRVFGELESSVRAHIEDGTLTMSIELPQETYHIEPSWRHLPTAKKHTMVAYKSSDVKFNHAEPGDQVPKTCGYIKEGLELEAKDNELNAREKRQSDQYEYTPTKTRCPLLLVADYRFFQEMGGGNTKTTINYLISLIDRVHKIYNDTVWQDRSDQEGFKGMGFVIKKIVVHSEPTRLRGGEAHYNMIREKWDVRNLLENTSRMVIHSI
ncbi:ADAM 17-like protease isoform X2 [Drosophila hydei]|uniref:ADAM 17-like protease isoform X2 n=1 Tax=Drosophila hydei TaxID=7224 RepID=A0A6J2SV08_DROHY|nr:ADAM 17-like protease isoform X2 [Drosophila hydei]